MVTGMGFELFENSMDGPRKSRKFQLNFPDPVIPINNERPLNVKKPPYDFWPQTFQESKVRAAKDHGKKLQHKHAASYNGNRPLF